MLTAHAIGDRYIVPREWFTQHDPDQKRRLSVGAARRLLAWYALRAARPSWPDELERRLRGAKAALLDALTPLADDIAEVRVAIDERDEELPADQPYHLVVFFVVDEDVWNADVPGRAAIYDAFTRFVTALGRLHLAGSPGHRRVELRQPEPSGALRLPRRGAVTPAGSGRSAAHASCPA